MLSENAKDIPGFEGVYAVTEDGRVYSHSRVVKAAHGSTQLRKGRWLKPKINQEGCFIISEQNGLLPIESLQ